MTIPVFIVSPPLYEQVVGEFVGADSLLSVIGLARHRIPRYRDCYLSDGGEMIILLTRLGGADNTETYRTRSSLLAAPRTVGEAGLPPLSEVLFIDDLRRWPGYLRDEESDDDGTFRLFYFEVPEDSEDFVKSLTTSGEAMCQRGVAAFMAITMILTYDTLERFGLSASPPALRQIARAKENRDRLSAEVAAFISKHTTPDDSMIEAEVIVGHGKFRGKAPELPKGYQGIALVDDDPF